MVADGHSVGFAGVKDFAHTPTVVEHYFLIRAFAHGCLHLAFPAFDLHGVISAEEYVA
jgi:hypothetical protein